MRCEWMGGTEANFFEAVTFELTWKDDRKGFQLRESKGGNWKS